MSATLISPSLVTRPTCRICGSRALTPVGSLGDAFVSGAFTKPDGQLPVQRRIPFDLVRCGPVLDQPSCGWVRWHHSVPFKVLYQSYWNRSGINQIMSDNPAGRAWRKAHGEGCGKVVS